MQRNFVGGIWGENVSEVDNSSWRKCKRSGLAGGENVSDQT
jgi:hypothetical protein